MKKVIINIMLSKPFILNELNKPSPPRSEDYVVDW